MTESESHAGAPSPAAPQSALPAAAIEIRGLTKDFRDFWLRSRVRAVDDLSLTVQSAEVFGLLGPNGSGKSTTIKVLLGLLHPTAGEVRVLGRPPSDVPIKERIGYLPEESYLYPFLTAREALDFYGRLFRIDRSERRARSEALLSLVGLEGAAERQASEYSKGMQRRLGLAQALINDPELLILDEPTSGLDPIASRSVKELILELRRRGKTVLLSSHLLADVEDVCDRVAILYGGRAREEGPVAELLTDSTARIIETDALSAEGIAEIRRSIEERGGRVRRVAAPRRRLETVFLDIVRDAEQRGLATSGAARGGAVPDFLRRRAQAAARGDAGAAQLPPAADGASEGS